MIRTTRSLSPIATAIAIAIAGTVALLALPGCDRASLARWRSEPQARSEATALPDPAAQADAQVAERIADLAARLHGTLAPGDENLAWSPSETLAGNSLLLAGTSGRTHRELLSVLRIHSFAGWDQDFAAFRRRSGKGTVASATRLWSMAGSSLGGNAGPDARRLAGSSPGTLPATMEAARTAIDTWVSSIAPDAGDLLPAGEPSPGTTIALTGATALTAEPTGLIGGGKGLFHRGDGHDVPASWLHGTLAGWSAEPPDCTLAALPVGAGHTLLVIALPRTRTGLGDLEAGLTGERLGQWRQALRRRTLSVVLPRFAITRTVDLAKAMTSLGAALPFGNQARFASWGPDEPGRMSVGLWRATTAIAVLGDGAKDPAEDEKSSADQEMDPATDTHDDRENGWPVTIDRPFLFGVLDQASGAWLMLGRVVEPDPAQAPGNIGRWADQLGGS